MNERGAIGAKECPVVEGGLDFSERLIEQVPLVGDGDRESELVFGVEVGGAFADKEPVTGDCCAVGDGVKAVGARYLSIAVKRGEEHGRVRSLGRR